ncbi:P22 phage major capsid protein family protein [Amycolatopsis sp. NPDC021455]|uniref:P22 phage major capsid protein family protein n=1 Tax=Amycolatopsis sp. NPDC021455 TaxID=3154901 RepID=UPI0033EFBE88
MANNYLKGTKIAAAALGLLEREIILPALVWRDAGGDFAGAGGDTISIRVPARTQARTRPLRGARPTASEGNGIITMDELTEHKVDVTLDEAIYNAVPITDEELALDITNFGQQILAPQVRAVAEGLENKLANEMVSATYATTLDVDTADPYKTLVDARVALNKANVPMAERTCVVGADLEGVFLKSEHLSMADKSGSDSALRDAAIGRVAGFGPIYVSNALPPDVGFCFHKTAYVLSMKAPMVPDGASYGSSQSYAGLAMRWIRDYDFRAVQDRSLIDLYAGTNHVADGATNEVQTVQITGSPTGGTYTLTYSGQTTSGIAYNASATAVQSALASLSTIGSGNVAVSGSAGGPYTVTFKNDLSGIDAAQLTASGSGLTGGTSPAVAVATQTGGDALGQFVRAIKFTL